MWGVAVGQLLLQIVEQQILYHLTGCLGFLIAVFLVTRDAKAARNNGALRLFLGFLGVLLHLLQNR